MADEQEDTHFEPHGELLQMLSVDFAKFLAGYLAAACDANNGGFVPACRQSAKRSACSFATSFCSVLRGFNAF